jgi:hypothetical protein
MVEKSGCVQTHSSLVGDYFFILCFFKDVPEISAGQNGSALRSKVVKDMCWNIYITKEEVTGYD